MIGLLHVHAHVNCLRVIIHNPASSINPTAWRRHAINTYTQITELIYRITEVIVMTACNRKAIEVSLKLDCGKNQMKSHCATFTLTS